ncbi:MAG: hypothetical protein WA322_02040 [Pseudolabrys sp.]
MLDYEMITDEEFNLYLQNTAADYVRNNPTLTPPECSARCSLCSTI